MKEDQHIEWKEIWRDEYLRWICGFANAQGGVLVIGRNDKGMAGLMLTFRANPAHLQAAARDQSGGTTQKILQILARNPSFSRREIAEALGDVSENGVKYHLERLRALGHIRRVGPDKGGH